MAKPLTKLHFIDDSADEHFINKMVLKRENLNLDYRGYETADAFFAETHSLERWRREEGIIAVDLNLTITDGSEVVKALRADERFGDAIVGICSGSEDPYDRQKALDAGADFFVNKPFNRRAIEAIATEIDGLEVATNADEKLDLRLTS
ncbi:MAG: response regulator [Pseudomonadota bacterium]